MVVQIPFMPAQRIQTEKTAELRPVDSSRPQFWKGKEHAPEYWSLYLERRPGYDEPFFDRLISFHRESNPPGGRRWSLTNLTAHDFATGPGQVARFLARHFSKVVASDINATHLASAEHFSKDPISDVDKTYPAIVQHFYDLVASLFGIEKRLSDNIEFVVADARELPSHYPYASASMVTIAEALPLMPVEGTIASAAHLLQPGGTLAIWFYGRPHFAPDPNDQLFDSHACNKLYGEIATSAFHYAFADLPKRQIESIKMTMSHMSNWLDHVNLPETDWVKVQRHKWNTDLKMEFIDHTDPVLGWEHNLGSRIGDREMVEYMRDQDMWSNMWTVTEWKEFLKINLPPLDDAVSSGMGLERKWNDLAQMMGGAGVRRKVRWPVVLILAARK